ncbi:hypothetical protein L195_g016369 [Trifolium pratense]|uniref:Uncharacterized protein n=1 Tax=Trifolium pratense TaxID=57577 RepID=A0A2K3MQV5_TRIPR|nr:hypothetical protein L195_g016369 [Trifolium pratense]
MGYNIRSLKGCESTAIQNFHPKLQQRPSNLYDTGIVPRSRRFSTSNSATTLNGTLQSYGMVVEGRTAILHRYAMASVTGSEERVQNEGNPDGVFEREEDESEKKGNLGRNEQWVVVVRESIVVREERKESITTVPPFKTLAIVGIE